MVPHIHDIYKYFIHLKANRCTLHSITGDTLPSFGTCSVTILLGVKHLTYLPHAPKHGHGPSGRPSGGMNWSDLRVKLFNLLVNNILKYMMLYPII